MIEVVAHQDQQGVGDAPHEVPGNIENEIAVVHAAAKGRPIGVGHFGSGFAQLVRPLVKHGVEGFAVRLGMPDGLHENRSGDSTRVGFDQAQSIGAADAAAQGVAAVDAQSVEQGDVVCGVRLPAVRARNRCAGVPGVALIHGDHTTLCQGSGLGTLCGPSPPQGNGPRRQDADPALKRLTARRRGGRHTLLNLLMFFPSDGIFMSSSNSTKQFLPGLGERQQMVLRAVVIHPPATSKVLSGLSGLGRAPPAVGMVAPMG